MSAFMQGLTAGSNVAAGWMDTYERSRKRKEEQDLKARREGIISAQPEDSGMRYSAEQGAELERIAQSGQYDIGYDQDRQAYTVTPKGLGAGQVNPMDGAVPPAGLGDPGMRMPEPAMYAPAQRYGTFMGQEYEGEMTPARLQGLRNRAMLDTVDDPFERQRLELTQMQTEEVRGKREREAATREAQAQLSEMYARGETPNAVAIMALAGKGADSAALMQTAAAALELDDKQIKASTNKLIADINKASTNPEKFNELLRQFDTNPNDDKVPTLRTNRDGTLQVFLGDEPMTQKFRDTKDMSALSQLAGFYKDQITGDRLGTAVQMATLDKLRAQTAAANRSSPGTPSLSQKIAETERALGRKLTAEEQSILAGLSNRPGLGGDKVTPVKEEGEKVMVNGRLMITDGMGGYLDPKAVVPSQRAQVLKAAEIPDNMIDQIQWNRAGTAVGFGGKMYDPKDPKDMRELKADYVRLGTSNIEVEEAQRNTPGSRVSRGFGPKLTYLPSEDSPSIYASPEQRAAFIQQRQQELLRQQQNAELAERMRGLYLQQQGQ